MARLNAHDRQSQIIELLNNNGSIKATELADYFSVSRETIRRDLNTLSENRIWWCDRYERFHNTSY